MGRRRKKKTFDKNKIIKTLILFIFITVATYIVESLEYRERSQQEATITVSYANLEEIPEYSGEVSVHINGNKPYFSEEDYTTQSFEKYSELDALGRCGVAYANISKETMPPAGDKREDISMVHPTGWKQTKVQGEFVYNRCHLIAYCLSDEDANRQNLITGTRYFNVEGMLPYENQVLEYMNKNKNNHVLYRVTPVFEGNNLLASGVEMEAYSVEDKGAGVCFNVYVYNVQPGAEINYANGRIKK